jgi:hypothetical protein
VSIEITVDTMRKTKSRLLSSAAYAPPSEEGAASTEPPQPVRPAQSAVHATKARELSPVAQKGRPQAQRAPPRKKDPKRGRPPKPVLPRIPLRIQPAVFARIAGISLSKVHKDIEQGRIRAIAYSEGVRKNMLLIPTSEFVRVGILDSLDELVGVI